MNLLLKNVKVQLLSRRYKRQLAYAERLRRQAAAADGAVLDEIRKLLASDSWEVRNCALKIIGKTKCETLYPRLIEKLLDRSEAGILRRNCVEIIIALGLRTPEVIDALSTMVHDGYWEVRGESARALALLAAPSEALEKDLIARIGRERNLDVRASLAQAIGAVGATRAAFDTLADVAVRDAWLVRYHAALAMLEMGAHHPDFAADAADRVRGLDLLAEGSATVSVFRQHILSLVKLMSDGRPYPHAETLRRKYFHLKQGWLKHQTDDAT